MVKLAIPVLVSLSIGCPGRGQSTQTAAPVKDPKMAELALLMKNEINPAFSKITFLVFHGHEMEDDPAAVKAEMARHADILRKSLGRLRVWTHPPTESNEGKEVFYAYALSVDKSTQKLVDAVERADNRTAAAQLENIAKACNNCHHFFRLKIEDSVVGPGAVTTSDATESIPPAAPDVEDAPAESGGGGGGANLEDFF